jgi:YidC/Oxa1 family membrane protein insertase
MEILTILFFNPLLNALMFFYKVLFSNLGFAIIALTIVLRVLIFPLNLKTLVSQRKVQHLKPHMDALKEKHKDDKMALSQAQMDLYKEHGVSPAGGCGWMLLQLPFLFGFFYVLRFVVGLTGVEALNQHLYTPWLYLPNLSALHFHFAWVNLGKPDPYYIFPVLAGLSQYFLSRLTLPPKPQAVKASGSGSFEDALASTSQQMVYIFPIMTFIFTLQFPSGLALYWTVGNVFSIIQQSYVNRRHPAPAMPAATPQIVEGTIVDTHKSKKKKKKK